MTTELTLYISAAQEMEAECEAVGQLLAGLLPSVRWTLHRTPTGRDNQNPDIRAIHESDLHLFILGTDIVAPMGVEWREAQQGDARLFLFRLMGHPLSPAASFFLHHTGVQWRRFESAPDLVRRFERQLITELIAGTPGYGLGLEEIESLRDRLEQMPSQVEPDETGARGAGQGGVILPKHP
ncbi:MAG: hypothetical protein ACP5G7_09295 [Anaerolineae bacterium]